ncbi:hypothetical protein [Actinomadura fibrosa]|uniref:Secreted protein n=1 Tax=Actinomadura fibrosa TaxID=111802 RepID=A0ABW2XIA1_9ACTN|nr:hypothetical protein [Actinomadura fibrosa]
MSWIPVLATAMGAVIGLGSALLTEHLRFRREHHQRFAAVRREAYTDYLSALHEANEAMRGVALGEYPDSTPQQAARAAFRAAGVTKAREHIILVAPPAVITAADQAFRSLRTMRDRIGQGEQLAEYEPVLLAYGEHLHELRDAIRHDLGASGGAPQIPL